MGDIYLSRSNFSRAAFCYEELMLHIPQNPNIICQYAEIIYSTGKKENIINSRKYFCYVLTLKPEHIRALWGLT